MSIGQSQALGLRKPFWSASSFRGTGHSFILSPFPRPQVTDPLDVMAIVQEAAQLRTTASTHHNDVSSRSHTVFTLSVVQQRDTRKPVTGVFHQSVCFELRNAAVKYMIYGMNKGAAFPSPSPPVTNTSTNSNYNASVVEKETKQVSY